MSEYWRLRPNQEQLERLQKAIKKYGTQGEIKLPKEDKYEEFKKWFENQDEIIWHSVKYNTGFIGSEPFNEFEKGLEEKQKEEKIKKIIADAITTTPLRETISPTNTIYCGDELIDKIYCSLSRGGYLK